MADEESSLTPASKWPLKLAAVVAIVLGVLALISPFRAGIAATLVLAWSFLIGGCLGVLAAFRIKRWTGTYGLMLLSIVSILAGLFIVGNPLIGLGTVTLVCIGGLFAAGLTKVFWGFKIRAGKGRWLIVLSGVMSIVVAGMLYLQFPFSAAWAFGVLVGLVLICEGAIQLAFLGSTP